MTHDELEKIAATEKQNGREYQQCIRVCTAAGCLSSHSDLVKEALSKEIVETGMKHQCQVKGVGCMGLCSAGPLVAVEPDGVLYRGVTPEDASDIIRSLDGHGKVNRLATPIEAPFFNRQVKIVLENAGIIDPERIEEYVAADGYTALVEVLTTKRPTEVIEQVVRSGLRGRGGAGFPTGLKWTTVAKAAASAKYVVCNADEGDPGAFMDRAVLESDPHRVIEGMAIAAYAVGAAKATSTFAPNIRWR